MEALQMLRGAMAGLLGQLDQHEMNWEDERKQAWVHRGNELLEIAKLQGSRANVELEDEIRQLCIGLTRLSDPSWANWCQKVALPAAPEPVGEENEDVYAARLASLLALRESKALDDVAYERAVRDTNAAQRRGHTLPPPPPLNMQGVQAASDSLGARPPAINPSPDPPTPPTATSSRVQSTSASIKRRTSRKSSANPPKPDASPTGAPLPSPDRKGKRKASADAPGHSRKVRARGSASPQRKSSVSDMVPMDVGTTAPLGGGTRIVGETVNPSPPARVGPGKGRCGENKTHAKTSIPARHERSLAAAGHRLTMPPGPSPWTAPDPALPPLEGDDLAGAAGARQVTATPEAEFSLADRTMLRVSRMQRTSIKARMLVVTALYAHLYEKEARILQASPRNAEVDEDDATADERDEQD
ncbi:hypothetical protein BV25DRAFT_1922316 [Artomyces pyxidatus]|uniref:Uncharacterized protein n=1 Tax=Artomyces pyxidatus TaxID=48021 RepID=A0ACB8SGE0_9AGAM|nr:hypothetical protein BV25DRAFT_1922316 [Artomyces pyxidatus]